MAMKRLSGGPLVGLDGAPLGEVAMPTRAQSKPTPGGVLARTGAGLAPHEQLTVVLDVDYINGCLAELKGYPLPKATGWAVLAMVVQPPSQIGSVHIAAESASRLGAGSIGAIVLDVGPLAYAHERFGGEKWVCPGDYIIINRYGGQQFRWFGGHLLTFLTDDSIFGRLPRVGEDEPTETSGDTPGDAVAAGDGSNE